MNMNEFYPAMYYEASSSSETGQKNFLFLTRLEYFLLSATAFLALPFSKDVNYFASVAVLFILLIVVTFLRAVSSPERVWYNGRAVAESIKTLTWRYAMCAEPFQEATDSSTPASNFRKELSALLKSNKELGQSMAGHSNTGDQITNGMNLCRSKAMVERLDFYSRNRIDEQRNWYSNKAKQNRRSFVFWIGVIISLYCCGAGAAVFRVANPRFDFWPIDFLIVLAGCGLGWMQIKKFNELSAAYGLTASEIGIIKTKVSEITSESEFVEFVKDAEFAFSREHTQWIARQSS